MKSIALLVSLALAPATMVGTSSARQPTRATDTEVTLAIYSGRVDPVWVLAGAETVELRKRLAALKVATVPFAEPARLGYLIIQLPVGGAVREIVTVSRGEVIRGTGATARSFIDTGRRLEKWLLKTRRGQTPEINGKTVGILRP